MSKRITPHFSFGGLLLVCHFLFVTPLINAAETSIGTIKKFTGNVQIIKIRNGATTQVDAKIGTDLFESDTLVTQTDSKALIIFIDGSSMNMLPETTCKLSRFKILKKEKGSLFSSAFDLVKGKVRLFMNNAIKGDRDAKIRTGNAVMGIRGTDIFIANNNGQGSMACIQCSQAKAPTIAPSTAPNQAQPISNGNVRSVVGTAVSPPTVIPKGLMATIKSTISNASHKYARAKKRVKDRKVTPRLVIESVSGTRKKQETNNSERTSATLLESYSAQKEKARYEADKKVLQQLFKSHPVEIRIAIEE